MSKARILLGATVLLMAVNLSFTVCARELVVGVILDGPSQRQVVPLSLIRAEIETLLGREFDISIPESKIRNGGWRIEGIRNAVRAQLADPEVDIVIANGLLASHEIAQIESLAKPVIATVVADPVLQNLPNVDGRSKRHNLVYLADDHTVGSDLDLFHSLIEFTHLAIIVDRLFFETLPQLRGTTAEAGSRLNIEISLIPIDEDVDSALAQLPANVDAVYIPPLPRVDDAGMRHLADQLTKRQLPSFALVGADTLEAGILMTGLGRSVDLNRAARRVALDLQSILLGTNAADLKVGLSQPQKLAINMRTARAIGYSPRWRELERAILLYEDADENAQQYSLVSALQHSVANNLSLRSDDLSRALARDQVSLARSTLLPQLSARFNASHIDEDRANPGISAERDADFTLSASQLIYSERQYANFDVSRLLRDAQDESFRVSVLDTIADTATAYLSVLQALAQESVLASNVSVTERNLELAVARRRIGQAGRADVLRWQSQLASDRQNLYAANATTDQARTELLRILNLDPQSRIAVSDKGIPALVKMLDSKRFQRFFDNPKRLAIFRQYQVSRAIENSPELKQLEFQISSASRELLAAKRSYYVPDMSIVGQAASNLYRGGAGSTLRGTGLDDEEWQIGLEASLPLFQGGARRANTNFADHQKHQLQVQLEDVQARVVARAVAAMQRTGGSYPAIRLSIEASEAAHTNLELVTQAYSVGTMSVTDLINAQDAAVGAKLSEAQARYAFMIDFIGIMRSVADFDLLLAPDGIERWYRAVDSYFTQHGA